MAASLVACGGGRGGRDGDNVGVAQAQPSAGQVAPSGSAASVSYYAAFRFAEQATFGPTPALVAELRAKGFERWIDEQMALPPYQIDYTPALIDGNPIPPEPYRYQRLQYQRQLLTAPDQLRSRLTWSISQFITASSRSGHPADIIGWMNMLQQQAFGNYADLLYQVSVSPKMAAFLNNDQNRPKSSECPNCAPNENYARELMQLFSIGVKLLNPDGTTQRDARGNAIETYKQVDVEQLARVLTGWEHPYDALETNAAQKLINYNIKLMRPTTWPPLRDSGAKAVLGRTFPAGQSQEKDLRDAIELLMGHQNIAPFVSLRLIQHLVKSNPTPGYVGRVAAVFRNDGNRVAGNLKAVVKAVLLDPEARAGDDPTKSRADDGKVREPVLHRTALYRALGCRQLPNNDALEDGAWIGTQPPLGPDSVFSYYAPTDRSPGSNLLAPEQKLLTGVEFGQRFGDLSWYLQNKDTGVRDRTYYLRAGCNLDPLVNAFNTSSRAFSDYLSTAYFRGAMPPTLRQNIDQRMQSPTWNTSQPEEGALTMLSYALATPYFGAMK